MEQIINTIELVFIVLTLGITVYFSYKTMRTQQLVLTQQRTEDLREIISKQISDLETQLGMVIFTSVSAVKDVPLHKLTDLYADTGNRAKLTDLLNSYEGLARGVNEKLYDEKLVKTARKRAALEVYSVFREFIHHRRRESNNKHLWEEFEKMVLKWELEDKKRIEKNT